MTSTGISFAGFRMSRLRRLAAAATAAAVLATATPASADCAGSCRSDYYACVHTSSVGNCSHRRSMCMQRCTLGGRSATLWGAIAYSPAARVHGYAFKHPSRGQAEGEALRQCQASGGKDCAVLVWFDRACGALALGPGSHGSAWAFSAAVAESKALANCNGVGRGACEIRRSFCSR